jgi:histone chaperone ASF1
VSSPGNEELDQELDDCLVGPVPVGVNSFEFEGSPPDPSKIPTEDVLGVAALILTGSYNDQEFVRVGYYQNTEYDNEEMKEVQPKPPIFERLVRDISTKPRVTRFQIKWYVHPLQSMKTLNRDAVVLSGMYPHHSKRKLLPELRLLPLFHRRTTWIQWKLIQTQNQTHRQNQTASL